MQFEPEIERSSIQSIMHPEYEQHTIHDDEHIQPINLLEVFNREATPLKAQFTLSQKNHVYSECMVCYETTTAFTLVQTACKHTYCIDCFEMQMWSQTRANAFHCGMCRQQMHLVSVHNYSVKHRIDTMYQR